MKKRKIQITKLSLKKQKVASVNAQSISGGTNNTLLETQLVVICTTTHTTTNPTIPITLSKEYTKCITDFACPSKHRPCPTDGPIIKTTFCH